MINDKSFATLKLTTFKKYLPRGTLIEIYNDLRISVGMYADILPAPGAAIVMHIEDDLEIYEFDDDLLFALFTTKGIVMSKWSWMDGKIKIVK